MIIWLNGTFGAGKTSTADRLAALVPGARVFDPETVGHMLSANLPDRPVADFQDWPAWRPLVAATLAEVARMTDQHVIAPQAVLKREYLEQIFTALRAADQEVFHVVLDAADAVLRSRIEGSDEASEWRLDHLDEYATARTWMVEMADLVVDTAASTPPQIARRILAALPGMPAPEPVKLRPSAPKPGPALKSVQSDKAGQPDKAAPADKPASADKAGQNDKAAPADKPGPADKAVPADKTVPADKAGPADKIVLAVQAEQAVPAGKSAQTG